MVVLERVMELQKSGVPDSEIVTQLQNEGISPREINEALNQSRVKSAVDYPANGQGGYEQGGYQQSPQQPGGMQPSIMQQPPNKKMTSEMPQQGQQMPMQPPMDQQQMQYPQQAPAPEVYPPEDQQQADEGYYPQTPQAYYDQQGYYAPQQGITDTETMAEIAEQVFSEKMEDLKKKIGNLPSFKNEIKEKIADLDERLKRIENSIEKLQNSVIGKVGEFGENTAMIHKDLENLHGTMSKMMNPLMDNYKELKRIAGKK